MKSFFSILLLFLSTTFLSAQGGVVSWTVNGEVRSVNTDTLFYRIATEGYTSEVQSMRGQYVTNMINFMPYEKQLEHMNYFRQAGKKYKCSLLTYEADFMDIWYFPRPTDSLLYVQLEMMKTFTRKMEKEKEYGFAFRGHEFICLRLWWHGEYSQAFKMFPIVEESLQHISDVNTTGVNASSKKTVLYWMGECYHQFRNYDKAVDYFKRSTSDPSDPLYRPYHKHDHINLRARKSLGVYYSQIDSLEVSDLYFQSVLTAPDSVEYRDHFDAMALCLLGINNLKRKNYDKAIEQIGETLPTLKKYFDYYLLTEATTALGECYLMKHDFEKTKEQIELAQFYLSKSHPDFRGDLYSLMSKYHAHIADPCLATAYMDSAVVARERTSEKYNSLIILRAEQELFAAEKAEIQLQKNAYRDRWVTISILAFILLSGLAISLCFYYKKQQAYKLLVKRSLEWSQIPIAPLVEPISIATSEQDEIIDPEADRKFMKKVCRIVENERLYTLPDFTLADLAKRMNLSTNQMSRVGNRTMGMNFKTFINEYRIKEAVKTLSQEDSPSKMEYLFREIGFQDRTSFYRSFKKVTGLSPSEFIKNRESIDDPIN